MNPKLKKIIKIIFTTLILIWIWYSFLYVNSKNYTKFREIKLNQINHPEWLPTTGFAKATSVWFDNSRADIFWLETIQYIGWNAVSSAYKKYLYRILNLVTDLNPYFLHPYKIWMLLLPEYNGRYEDLEKKEQLEYVNQWIKLWLKGMKNFCKAKDKDWNLKIDLILKEDNLQKIWSEEKYKNPCTSYEIPYYLAYIYYFYIKDNIAASNYYKIASAHTDSVEWAKILSAIMRWKGWDREKAFLMFLNIWKNLDSSEDQVCSKFSDILQNQVWFKIFQEKNLDSNLIKYANNSREKLFWEISTDDSSLKLDTECPNYINKATRELNLHYVEQANLKYKSENSWENAKNAKILFDSGYIKYLPIDYQQEKDYWIIYAYNSETWFFDYEMGNY